MDASKPETLDFVTLGMFIIDDIYPPPTAPEQTPRKDVIGGAGTYSAIGARLFSPAPRVSKTVGWIIDAGTDFPVDICATISSWQTSALILPRNALTTRGWNGYSENEHRAFKYLTEKKRLEAADLTPQLLRAKSFHLICSPSRCITMIKQILERRRNTSGDGEKRPLMIWEPVPDLCIPAEMVKTLEALQYVDVISPNHDELAALFSHKHGSKVDKALLESHAQRLLAQGIGRQGQGAVVVRAGREGCYIASPTIKHWLPAYHQNAFKVVDPTGGGNGFLGGVAVGLVRTEGDIVEAARMGSIAASYCIEQVGMPVLTSSAHTDSDDDKERWNGTDVNERLEEFRKRTAS
ncbi:hypothetical protein LTR62_004423 [Meristemomyces frigidus]|uniref:Carbohydrate kinase PfkB domain-containing protein n=1 Tax=Meristemomyces frigidus TaxID=1508187 RepID=A0AAN7YRE5_9PEZI|nr:hypothetical protein LTR62_004423 [Meristemomyces frigidus]